MYGLSLSVLLERTKNYLFWLRLLIRAKIGHEHAITCCVHEIKMNYVIGLLTNFTQWVGQHEQTHAS